MRLLLLTTLIFGFVFTACSVNKRDPQTPPLTVKKVSTDFFFEFSGDRKSYKSKRFLFGSSIEDKTGLYSGIFLDHYNTSGSANIEFEFNAEGSKLVGKLVNPTYPNNKDKWEVFLTFDISGNYYEENRVDPSGRQSQDVSTFYEWSLKVVISKKLLTTEKTTNTLKSLISLVNDQITLVKS